MIFNIFKIPSIKEIQWPEKYPFQSLPITNNLLLDKSLYQSIILILQLLERLLPLKFLRKKEVIGTEEQKREKLIGSNIILKPVGFRKVLIRLIKMNREKRRLINMLFLWIELHFSRDLEKCWEKNQIWVSISRNTILIQWVMEMFNRNSIRMFKICSLTIKEMLILKCNIMPQLLLLTPIMISGIKLESCNMMWIALWLLVSKNNNN